MAKQKSNGLGGLVYSTDPGFKISSEGAEEQETISPAEQKLQVSLDTKHRGGKAVTIIRGFVGKEDDHEALAKKLKAFCGTGGSVKDADILVQGDNREKVLQWLVKKRLYYDEEKITIILEVFNIYG